MLDDVHPSLDLALHQHLTHPNDCVLGRYNWDKQTQVVAIKEALQARGIPCWIDVDPSRGMKQDIFDSMACAVQNSVVVCCFMTTKYQSSSNCKLGELAYPPGSTAVDQWLAFS
jgi:hypothetical protein|eukprot:SAG25_NODE_17_length_24192_cov_70.399452_14_plen_114_part_00